MHYDLTSTQKEFLKITNCFIHAKSCEVSEDFLAFEELYKLAAIHRVTAAVFDIICQDARACEAMGQELFARWKMHAIREVSLQAQKTCGFLQLYQQMGEVGLRPLVVKGIIRRQMYDKSDYCSSSDEDLLIRREDFALCDAFLLQRGFKRQEIDPTHLPVEISYLHPTNSIYLEVHLALFPERDESYGDLNRDFSQAFDTCVFEEIEGVQVWTLEPTLHMWYLICHSLKHFLHSGFGVRQICDMVKMAEFYGERIHWETILELIRKRKLERYWGGILDIAVKYLGFEPEEICEDICPVQMDGTNFLLDLFDSGIYGSSSLARRQSSNMTLTAAKKGRKSTLSSLWHSLFPGREYMQKKFAYLKKRPWMLPVAWGQRLKGYVRAQNNGKDHKSIQIGMQRVELLKQYGLLRK